MKTTIKKATAMVVEFGHADDARTYHKSLGLCDVVSQWDFRTVTVPLTTARNNEVARNTVPDEARVFWK